MSVLVSVSVVVGTPHKKEESLKPVGVLGFFLELLARFELATSSLPKVYFRKISSKSGIRSAEYTQKVDKEHES